MKDSNEIPDYNLIHVKLAAEYVAISKAKVLVVGCNTGKDCMSFIKLGAPKVFGLDVVPNVGSDFQHSDIEYYQNSVEDMPFEDNTFDLVFALQQWSTSQISVVVLRKWLGLQGRVVMSIQ